MGSHFKRIVDIFNQAKAKRPGDERQRFLDEACRNHPEWRIEIDSRLRAFDAENGSRDPSLPVRKKHLRLPSPLTASQSEGKSANPERLLETTAAVPEVIAEKSGDRIDRYKLLEKIGEGGMGTVWMAEQTQPVRRRVAIKLIKRGMDSSQVLARFEAERQALALMDHPHIAKVLDAGTTMVGRPYFVMELVKGIPLTRFCDDRCLSIRDRLDLFISICHAIQHAHHKGIIHRDIKPSNILVATYDHRPVPKVIDFGVVKAIGQQLTERTLFTGFGAVIGTLEYMSPEQAEFNQLDIDTRSDIYSLGVLLYELLTGTTPLIRKSIHNAAFDAVLRRIREEEPPRPSTRLSESKDLLPAISAQRQLDPVKLRRLLRGDLDLIVMKALEKQRHRRYETASSLALDIQHYLDNEPVSARRPGNVYLLQKIVRRHRLPFAAASAVIASLVLGLGFSLRQSFDKIEAYQRASNAESETKRTLAASDFFQAVYLIEQDKANDALPYLVRSLRNNLTNQAASTRLATLLAYRSWMLPALTLLHNGSVNCAQFSPDGKRIVTASSDGTANVWDAKTGERVTQPLLHSGWIHSAHFSSDGERIVTASGFGTALTWDAFTGSALGHPFRHGGAVRSAQFSPDGRRIATASEDATARVWDALTAEPLTNPLQHDDGIRSAQFSPEGNRLVTSSDDHTARVWDAHTGRPLADSLQHAGAIYLAQFSPDGNRLLTASEDHTARVWDAHTGQPLTALLQHANAVYLAQFSPNGKHIVTASRDGTARVWDAETGQPRPAPLQHSGPVVTVQFSPDGNHLVTASDDHTARVWDVHTGEPLTEPLQHGARVRSAQFSPDGKRIVTASDDHTARVWDVHTAAPHAEALQHNAQSLSAQIGVRIALVSRDSHSIADLHAMPPPTEPLLQERRGFPAQFSPDGMRIVAASNDKTAIIWDVVTEKPIKALKHGTNVTSARFSPDGKQIVTGCEDGTARIWDAHTGRLLIESLKHKGAVRSARFSPDGQQIVTASEDGTVRVWDTPTGQQLNPPMQHGFPVLSAQFSPDTKRVLTAQGKTAHIWEAQTGQPVTEPLQHDASVLFAQFSPDGKRIVTASADYSARLWDAHTGQSLTDRLPHRGGVFSAQFSPDGKRVVSASDAHTARVWDALTGQPLTDWLHHRAAVLSAQFSPDGKRIVTASKDRTARVWDAQTGRSLSTPLQHRASVLSAHFSPDGKRIVTTSRNHTVRVWDIAPTTEAAPEWLIDVAEAIGGQTLNRQGLLEPTRLNRFETLENIREKLNRASSENDWVVWGRWFLANPATRTISPFSRLTLTEHNARRAEEDRSPLLR